MRSWPLPFLIEIIIAAVGESLTAKNNTGRA
jgi:hypothetical protein